jgi:hypothetical protein
MVDFFSGMPSWHDAVVTLKNVPQDVYGAFKGGAGECPD